MSNPRHDTYELKVQDPSTEQWHTFAGTTLEEAEAAADVFFGADEADELEQEASTVASNVPTQSALLAKLHQLQPKKDKALRRRDAHAIAYASTPDGAAETFRRYELALDEEQRRTLRGTYLSGLSMAEDEYQQRLSRGNTGDDDGPLSVIPVGDFGDPLARALVEHRVMGTYRVPPSADVSDVTVTLMRLLPDGQTRKRLRLRVAAEGGALIADLIDIVAAAWAREADGKRLRTLLDDAAEPVGAAIQNRVAQG